MTKTRIAIIAGFVLAIAFVAFTLIGSHRVKAPPTHFTFERDVQKDQGMALVPQDLTSTDNSHVRLTEVFSAERTTAYAGFAKSGKPSGGELTVEFIWKSGDKKDRTDKFIIEEDKTESDNSGRNRFVAQKKIEFGKRIGEFVAPVSVHTTFGIALDVTEGVKPELAKRVRQVIDETRAVQLGADKKNSVVLNLYNITQSPYQGGRERPNLASPSEMKASIDWLVKERPSQSQSSILRGLEAVLLEMIEYRDQNPRLDIFTDGLENLQELSVYRDPSLLDVKNWSKLDEVADLKNFKLKGLTIHIHPLPAASPSHANMMEKGLDYLADRLRKAEAKVIVDPL